MKGACRQSLSIFDKMANIDINLSCFPSACYAVHQEGERWAP